MFVDASAIVAIITHEPDAETLADAIEHSHNPLTSAIAIYEAVLAVNRKTPGGLAAAESDVATFLKITRIAVVPITHADATTAVQAFAAFGRGRHPAKLNMGDCFAYASARAAGCSLLFKGDEFSRTDIPSAIAAR